MSTTTKRMDGVVPVIPVLYESCPPFCHSQEDHLCFVCFSL